MIKLPLFVLIVLLLFFSSPLLVSSHDVLLYDSSAYTECLSRPELPLYNGGILKDQEPIYEFLIQDGKRVNVSSFPLQGLRLGTKYCFSAWIRTDNENPALIRARVEPGGEIVSCIGTVIAKKGCWSFLKGGFVLNMTTIDTPDLRTLYIQNVEADRDVNIEVASASLQPFTDQEWRYNQDLKINETRRRAVIFHVTDPQGKALQGATVKAELVLKDFPFGAAISETIIGNARAQKWFTDRFNVAVFEDQLKWYSTEQVRGQVNYSVPDKMLEFARSNQIMVRGHNIVWTAFGGPPWSKNLTGADLQSAVDARVESVVNKYKGEFVNWDVNNEMLHNSYLEDQLGPNATLEIYKKVQRTDPLVGLFMNEYSVVEGCNDANSTVDRYIEKIRELERGGIVKNGIGLQGHFRAPNPPLIRGILDKFATLGIPIWMTEIDMSQTFTDSVRALQLEEVLRETYSHPAVEGILMWTAIRLGTCYKMCLTDLDYNNLVMGDAVDKLLQEWDTKVSEGQTDDHGAYSFFATLGQYKVTVKYGNCTVQTTFPISRGIETKHFNIQI